MVNWNEVKVHFPGYQQFFVSKDEQPLDAGKIVVQIWNGIEKKEQKLAMEIFFVTVLSFKDGWKGGVFGQPITEYPLMALAERAYDLLKAKHIIKEVPKEGRNIYKLWKQKHAKEIRNRQEGAPKPKEAPKQDRSASTQESGKGHPQEALILQLFARAKEECCGYDNGLDGQSKEKAIEYLCQILGKQYPIADTKELKDGVKKLFLAFHPDKNKSPDAEECFRFIVHLKNKAFN